MWAKIWQKIIERWTFLTVPYGQIAYGQNAEDIVLTKFLDGRLKTGQKKGFYIDIGAHHPFRYSNTYYFYKKGWRGLNIDADDKAIKLFKLFRPRDISVQALVADQNKLFSYFIFSDRAFNTCDSLLAKELIKSKRAKLIKKTQIRSQNLAKLLKKHLIGGQKIDFLSIDVEAMDDSVLQAYDFANFAPEFVLIEDLAFAVDIFQQKSKKIARFLKKQGYHFVSQVFNTAIWQKKTQTKDLP
jgi:hypothetical protein